MNRLPLIVAGILILLLAEVSLSAEGGLTTELLTQFRNSFQMNPHTRAMYNAITNGDIKNLALNRDLLNRHNEVFSHKIKVREVTNQKSSGRCWLFAGLNIMRPHVTEKYKLPSFEFSQNYLSFWDKMEKGNCFLEQIIEFRDRDLLDREMEIILRNPFGDGGWWNYMVDLVEQYGVVPKEVMPETNSSENTGAMNDLISRKLRADAVRLRQLQAEGKSVEELRTAKDSMMAELYRMLVMNLGEPPTEFPYRFENRDSVVSALKTYTPHSFYKEFVGIDLNEYVTLFNDPTREYGKHYQVRMSRNIYDRPDMDYANLETGFLKELAAKSVLDNEPVWFACDVGKDQHRQKGIMAVNLYDYSSIYGSEFAMTKADRALYREGSINHAMALVGVDIRDSKAVKWLVENSWGTENGSGGFWTMYDNWFDNYVFNIIVKKKYVPAEVLKIFDQPVTTIPPWDPMFEMIR